MSYTLFFIKYIESQRCILFLDYSLFLSLLWDCSWYSENIFVDQLMRLYPAIRENPVKLISYWQIPQGKGILVLCIGNNCPKIQG